MYQDPNVDPSTSPEARRFRLAAVYQLLGALSVALFAGGAAWLGRHEWDPRQLALAAAVALAEFVLGAGLALAQWKRQRWAAWAGIVRPALTLLAALWATGFGVQMLLGRRGEFYLVVVIAVAMVAVVSLTLGVFELGALRASRAALRED